MLILEVLGIMGRFPLWSTFTQDMLLMWDLQYPSPYSWIVGIVGPRYLCLQLPQNHSRPHGGRCQSERCWSSRRGPLLFHRWRVVCYPVLSVRCGACGDSMGNSSRYVLDMMQISDIPLFYIYIYTIHIYIYYIYIYCEITRQPVVNLLQLLLYAPFCLLAYKCKL